MTWDQKAEYEVEMARQLELRKMESQPYENAMVQYQQLIAEAEANERYQNRCTFCKKKVVYIPFREAVGEGHIYSDAGRDEFGITRLCEWCFDKVTKEPEIEDGPIDGHWRDISEDDCNG